MRQRREKGFSFRVFDGYGGLGVLSLGLIYCILGSLRIGFDIIYGVI